MRILIILDDLSGIEGIREGGVSMALTPFGLALLVTRLERERSYEACTKLVEALEGLLVEDGEMVTLDLGGRFYSVYFNQDALVDDLISYGKQALGWTS